MGWLLLLAAAESASNMRIQSCGVCVCVVVWCVVVCVVCSGV
jgi:hypothetical protein